MRKQQLKIVVLTFISGSMYINTMHEKYEWPMKLEQLEQELKMDRTLRINNSGD